MEHYRVKHGKETLMTTNTHVEVELRVEMKQERTLFYRPFKALEGGAGMAVPPKVSMIQAIQAAIDAQDWTSARKESVILIETALEGLRYLQTYVFIPPSWWISANMFVDLTLLPVGTIASSFAPLSPLHILDGPRILHCTYSGLLNNSSRGLHEFHHRPLAPRSLLLFCSLFGRFLLFSALLGHSTYMSRFHVTFGTSFLPKLPEASFRFCRVPASHAVSSAWYWL